MADKRINQTELRAAVIAFISEQAVNDIFTLKDILNYLCSIQKKGNYPFVGYPRLTSDVSHILYSAINKALIQEAANNYKNKSKKVGITSMLFVRHNLFNHNVTNFLTNNRDFSCYMCNNSYVRVNMWPEENIYKLHFCEDCEKILVKLRAFSKKKQRVFLEKDRENMFKLYDLMKLN